MNSPVSFHRNVAATTTTAASISRRKELKWAASLCLVVVLHLVPASVANAYCPACGQKKPETCGRDPDQKLCNECKSPEKFEDAEDKDEDDRREDSADEHHDGERGDDAEQSSDSRGNGSANSLPSDALEAVQELIDLINELQPGNPPSHDRQPGSNQQRRPAKGPSSNQHPSAAESVQSLQELIESLKPGEPPSDAREPGSNESRFKDTTR